MSIRATLVLALVLFASVGWSVKFEADEHREICRKAIEGFLASNKAALTSALGDQVALFQDGSSTLTMCASQVRVTGARSQKLGLRMVCDGATNQMVFINDPAKGDSYTAPLQLNNGAFCVSGKRKCRLIAFMNGPSDVMVGDFYFSNPVQHRWVQFGPRKESPGELMGALEASRYEVEVTVTRGNDGAPAKGLLPLSSTAGEDVLTYADICALAGDFLSGTKPEQDAIGYDPAAQKYPASENDYTYRDEKTMAEKFMKVVNDWYAPLTSSLPSSALVNQVITRLIGMMDKERVSRGRITGGDAESKAYDECANYKRCGWEHVTNSHNSNFAYITSGLMPSISYHWQTMTMAAVTKILGGSPYYDALTYNFDHFADGRAEAVWRVGHTEAMKLAIRAKTEKNPSLLIKAFLVNAQADHYACDLFSAGHIRTPRVAMYSRRLLARGLLDGCDKSYVGLAANMMHDEDSFQGLFVKNAYGSFKAYGDKNLNHPDNAKNKAAVISFVKASLGQVLAAYNEGKVQAIGDRSSQSSPLGFIPQLDTAAKNHAPLWQRNPEATVQNLKPQYLYRTTPPGQDPKYTDAWDCDAIYQLYESSINSRNNDKAATIKRMVELQESISKELWMQLTGGKTTSVSVDVFTAFCKAVMTRFNPKLMEAVKLKSGCHDVDFNIYVQDLFVKTLGGKKTTNLVQEDFYKMYTSQYGNNAILDLKTLIVFHLSSVMLRDLGINWSPINFIQLSASVTRGPGSTTSATSPKTSNKALRALTATTAAGTASAAKGLNGAVQLAMLTKPVASDPVGVGATSSDVCTVDNLKWDGIDQLTSTVTAVPTPPSEMGLPQFQNLLDGYKKIGVLGNDAQLEDLANFMEQTLAQERASPIKLDAAENDEERISPFSTASKDDDIDPTKRESMREAATVVGTGLPIAMLRALNPKRQDPNAPEQTFFRLLYPNNHEQVKTGLRDLMTKVAKGRNKNFMTNVMRQYAFKLATESVGPAELIVAAKQRNKSAQANKSNKLGTL